MENYNDKDLNITAITEWVLTKNNIDLKIFGEIEPIYNEVYYKDLCKSKIFT